VTGTPSHVVQHEEAACVRQRNGVQQDIVRAGVVVEEVRRSQREEVPMRQHRALGRSGRARCRVEDPREVLRAGLHGRGAIARSREQAFEVGICRVACADANAPNARKVEGRHVGGEVSVVHERGELRVPGQRLVLRSVQAHVERGR